MHTEFNREWWKMKVYNEISEYLKHPTDDHKLRLARALAEYEQIFTRLADSANDSSRFISMELSMNEY